MNRLAEQGRTHYAQGVAHEIEPVVHTLSQVFEDAVADFPHRVAIDFLGRTFTYSQLHTLIRRAVNTLTLCGVRRGDVVALVLPNCPQHYIAFYAAAYLGATVSEHNPLAPPAQLEEQLRFVHPKVVIAWEQTLEKLLPPGSARDYTYLAVDLTRALPRKSQLLLKLPVRAARAQRAKLRGKVPIDIHSWDDVVESASPADLELLDSAQLDDIAVLIQTGGTTGVPKAVELSHRNIVSNAAQVVEWLHTFERGAETIGAVLPFFHAFGLQLSLSVCVQLAATQVMLPTFDPEMLMAGDKRHPITMLCGVPPMFQKILKLARERNLSTLTSLRFSMSGAMPLAPELAREWEEFTGGLMIEGYGMTECAPVVAGSPLNEERRPSTLGVLFPSTEARIVDPDDPDRDMPSGEVGELLVKGPQVFVGYYENPEETAAAFHDGWLRTGDLVVEDNGFLVMADRRKELIINGGFNVYPSEVEKALRDMEEIEDVAVVGMPNGSVGEMVVAAIVLAPGASVDVDAVRRWTENKLSHYAMPKSIAIFDDLPRSQLGKVMRKNVREQLDNFELVSGEWKKRIESASSSAQDALSSAQDALNNAQDTFGQYLQQLRERTNSSAEELREWLEQSRPQLERFKAWFAENTAGDAGSKQPPTEDEVQSTAQKLGVTAEQFINWLKEKASSTEQTSEVDDLEVPEVEDEEAKVEGSTEQEKPLETKAPQTEEQH